MMDDKTYQKREIFPRRCWEVSGIEHFINCFIDSLLRNKIYSTFARGRLPRENFSDKLLFLLLSFILFLPRSLRHVETFCIHFAKHEISTWQHNQLEQCKKQLINSYFRCNFVVGCFFKFIEKEENRWVDEWVAAKPVPPGASPQVFFINVINNLLCFFVRAKNQFLARLFKFIDSLSTAFRRSRATMERG